MISLHVKFTTTKATFKDGCGIIFEANNVESVDEWQWLCKKPVLKNIYFYYSS